MKDLFKSGKLKAIAGDLIRETLQAFPFIGTIVTNMKEDTDNNPKGSLNFSKWDIYRLVLGIGAAYAMAKGILTQDQIDFILSAIGLNA